MRTSRSRAPRATSFSWAMRRGGSCRLREAMFGWRMRGSASDNPVLAGRGTGAERRALACGQRSSRRGGSAARRSGVPRAHDEWMIAETGLDRVVAEEAVAYLAEGRRALGVIPSQDTLVLERFFDQSGGMQLVLHAPFGSRINKAWGLALRKRFCRQFNFELQAAATDDALMLSLGPQHSFPLSDVFRYLHPRRRETCSCRPSSTRPYSRRGGDGIRPSRWQCRARGAGARCHRRSSGCARTT